AADGHLPAPRSFPTRRSSDLWIGLYAPGSGNNAYLAWIYVSCSQSRAAASAAGSCPFTIPSGLAPGSYELRLYPNDTFTRLATSGTFTVTGSGGAVLSVSPTSLAAGGTVTATWSGIAAPTPGDWIGLYAPGSGNNAYLAWIYVSCSQSRAAASAAGSCPFTIPSGLAPGSYELRLYPNDTFTRLATSGTFTVTGFGGAQLSIRATSRAGVATVAGNWSGIPAPTPGDWIGLYVPGNGDNAHLARLSFPTRRSSDLASAAGSCPFTIPSGLAPGSYELRLYPNDTFTRLATSNPFGVT